MLKQNTSLLLVFLFFFAAIGNAQNDPRPNILWIIAEDMSQDQGCYGNKLVYTPTIDKLASEGMRFTHMFTTAGVCAPSRTALATGMYQNAIGAIHMRYAKNLKPPLPGGVKTIAHILRDKGYQTFGNGKDDYMFKLEGKSFEFKKLDALDKTKPFFAKVNSFYTHRIFKQDESHPIYPKDVELPPYYPDVKPLREDWAAYLENIQLLDREVKSHLAEFEQRGLLENTIVFFFSDHGRPMLRGKYWMYDSGTRVPFIVYIPKTMTKPRGYQSGTVSHRLLSAIDISATTLALARVKVPSHIQGQVFLGANRIPERDYIFGSVDRIGGVQFKTRAVRSKRYRYIKNFHNGLSILERSTEYRKARLPYYNTVSILDCHNRLQGAEKTLVTPLALEELYDLENDPFEINNLAYQKEHEQVRQQMETVLTDWIEDIDDKGFYPDSPAIQKHFNDYRRSNKEQYRKERLKSYLEIKKQLQQTGKL